MAASYGPRRQYLFAESIAPAAQARRSCVPVDARAVSIPANIAEGKGRASPNEFARFLSIATGSLREVETFIELVDRLGLAKHATVIELFEQADETVRVLYGLEQATRRQKPQARRPKPTSDS